MELLVGCYATEPAREGLPLAAALATRALKGRHDEIHRCLGLALPLAALAELPADAVALQRLAMVAWSHPVSTDNQMGNA